MFGPMCFVDRSFLFHMNSTSSVSGSLRSTLGAVLGFEGEGDVLAVAAQRLERPGHDAGRAALDAGRGEIAGRERLARLSAACHQLEPLLPAQGEQAPTLPNSGE